MKKLSHFSYAKLLGILIPPGDFPMIIAGRKLQWSHYFCM